MRALDSLQRRGRLTPNPTGKRLRLTKRDFVFLSVLHRHGPLASSFLLAFAAPLGMNRKRGLERLCDLFHEDNTAHGGAYLTRPPQQFQTLGGRYNQLIYDLAPAGVCALRDAGLWHPGSGASGGPWWHKYMVSSITSSIELGTLEQERVSFIAQSHILDRASAQLSYLARARDPETGAWEKRKLTPDAVFGLEHHLPVGSRFRFFALEADRATEPVRTGSSGRKSVLRSLRQYADYIGNSRYKSHLRLTAPMLGLFVTTNSARHQSHLKIASGLSTSFRSRVLFQTWEDFASPPLVPKPNKRLLHGDWERSGLEDLRIL